MTYVRLGTSRAPRPSHDVTGQSLNMDLFQVKAETGAAAKQALEERMCRHTQA